MQERNGRDKESSSGNVQLDLTIDHVLERENLQPAVAFALLSNQIIQLSEIAGLNQGHLEFNNRTDFYSIKRKNVTISSRYLDGLLCMCYEI